jgi:hypothetical protein
MKEIKLNEIFRIKETGHLYKYELCKGTTNEKYYTFVKVIIKE